MAIIKQISVFDGTNWNTDDIGANANHIDLTAPVAGQSTVQGALSKIVGSSALTANRALVTNGSGVIVPSNVTSQQLGYLSGVTSNVQEQLDAIGAKADMTTSFYGTCNTPAGTAAKTITVQGATPFVLAPGVLISVYFNATNTAQNPTFNVNGTGAKQVRGPQGVLATTELWAAGQQYRCFQYVYTGTRWDFTSAYGLATPQYMGLMSLGDKQKVDKLNSEVIKYGGGQVDNLTINANAVATAQFSYTNPSGYNGIKLLHVGLANASNSGARAGNCYVFNKWASSSAGKVYVQITNRGTDSSKIKVQAGWFWSRQF